MNEIAFYMVQRKYIERLGNFIYCAAYEIVLLAKEFFCDTSVGNDTIL